MIIEEYENAGVDSKKVDILKKDPFKIGEMNYTEELGLFAVSINGEALEAISRRAHTEKLCLAAVRNNGKALKYVSKRLLTREICFAAVQTSEEALSYVPNEVMDFGICEESVARWGKSIDYVPEFILSEKLIYLALETYGGALKYLSEEARTEALCIQAVQKTAFAIEYVPEKTLTRAFLAKLISTNPYAIQYVPKTRQAKALCELAFINNPKSFRVFNKRFKTAEMCERAVKACYENILGVPKEHINNETVQFVIERLLEETEIEEKGLIYLARDIMNRIAPFLSLCERRMVERKTGLIIETKALYDKGKEVFIVEEKKCQSSLDCLLGKDDDLVIYETESFDEFYNYLNGDLKEAMLVDFDFEDIDLKKYNTSGAFINRVVLENQEVYDGGFYTRCLENVCNEHENHYEKHYELVPAESVIHDIIESDKLIDNNKRVYYISDLHIDHKIRARFPERATKEEVQLFLIDIVNQMLSYIYEDKKTSYLLIAGDVSCSFEICEMFYRELAKKWTSSKIIAVLGNHELWDYSARFDNIEAGNIDKTIDKFCNMFNREKIVFLNNSLYVEHLNSPSEVVPINELTTMSEEKLKDICKESSFVVYGGVGFSGLCKEYNASHGLYRNAVKTIEDDLMFTSQFCKGYEKLKESLGNRNVIVLSHTPRDNWSSEEYVKGWIYVNGHTHHNTLLIDDEKSVYSDNQIGYKNPTHQLKYFELSETVDLFKDYTDGIYKITREQYFSFYRALKMNISFRRVDGEIYMLKKSNIYCFIFKWENCLYLLNGGEIRSLINGSLKYYYDSMDVYLDAINDLLNGYNTALKNISREIKRFGGSGKVHGCIVDIDYFNHVYLDINEGKIYPYYARSVVSKQFYQNVSSLLKDKCPELSENYQRLSSNDRRLDLYSKENSLLFQEDSIFVSDTLMYSPSRTMKFLQYATEMNVIRVWNEGYLTYYKEKKRSSDKCAPLLMVN